MPLYDNINDALLLTADGAYHTVSLDTQGSTLETDESTYLYSDGAIWLKIDLSSYPVDLEVNVTIQATRTGGDANFHPYAETYKVYNGTFNPASPEFNKIKYVSGAYVGDGTTTPPSESFILYGGTHGSVAIHSGESINGIFYILLVDWNHTSKGIADFTYAIDSAPICYNAVDIINPDSMTASVVSGRVKETYMGISSGIVPENQQDATLKFTWTGNSDLYKVSCKGRYPNPGFGTMALSYVTALISINGKAITPCTSFQTFNTFDTDETWYTYPGLTDGTWDYTDNGLTWVPLNTGDLVEVFVISDSNITSPTEFIPFHIETICFSADVNAPSSTYSTPIFRFPAKPLGDEWGSPMGWGGQKLIPDEIWTDSGITPYDEGNFPWGVNWTDYDMCALADGTVYVIYHESYGTSLGAPSGRNHYITIKKYDPGADSWSQVSTINVNTPTNHYDAEAVSCEYDGTYVYFVWWELDSYTSSPYTRKWKWHCKRLDPSDDSITELGTGQAANYSLGVNYPGSVLANSIACAGNGGDIYVCATEYNDNTDYNYRLYVWRWNGSTWTNLNLPDPTVTGDPSPWGWEVSGHNSFYDVLSSMVCARHGEGPVTDGITLSYSYYWYESTVPRDSLITIPYTVGAGWGTEIRTGVGTVESGPPDRVRWSLYPDEYDGTWISLDLMWSTNLSKLVLCADFLHGGSDGFWDILKMNDAGTQWETYNTIAPAQVIGTWNQGKNTAAIGPDGEIYAFKNSTTTDRGGDWFTPKVFKSSPGYLAGYSVGAAPAMGEAATPYMWNPFFYATAHSRIRIVENNAYVMGVYYMEGYNKILGWNYEYGEGVYIFKLSYGPTAIELSRIRFRAWQQGNV